MASSNGASASTTSPYEISTEDWHTAGEPFRIVSALPPHCSFTSQTVRERRLEIINSPGHPVDELRRTLCHEPRGHADMYGGFITPPDDEGAHFGVLFWHKDGFSTACGHGTIALGYWAVQSGLVPTARAAVKQRAGDTAESRETEEETVDVVIDVPSGRVTAQVVCVNGKPTKAHFVNVPSYLLKPSLSLTIPSRPSTTLSVDIGWGGAIYAYIDAKTLDLGVRPWNHDEFVRLGREVKDLLVDQTRYESHELYGVCFYEDGDGNRDELKDNDHHDSTISQPITSEPNSTISQLRLRRRIASRNVVVFADGQIDRSPCGSGTAARVAILLAQGKMDQSSKLEHRSIINTAFCASIDRMVKSPNGYPACVPRVTGTAYVVARSVFVIDPNDPTYPGFVFR